MGVHQKIDRVAHRALLRISSDSDYFPGIKEIIHFEGLNGPDGIKRKSPGRDEPWHYIDPTDPEDRSLITMINDHIYNLTEALRHDNHERAAFEAAWMAHAITDGLTPAHHYPLEEKLGQLRPGETLETRNTFIKKLLMPGKNRRSQIRNNWEFWGAKGVMTTHLAFELGIASSLAGHRMNNIEPSEHDIERIKHEDFEKIFIESLHHVASLRLYEEFSRAGWTRRLAHDTRATLIPIIIETVCLAWYKCLLNAQEPHK